MRCHGPAIAICLFALTSAPSRKTAAAIPLAVERAANAVNLLYTPHDGQLHLDLGDDHPLLTTFRVDSAGALLRGDRPGAINGPFDLYTNSRAFKFDPAGFEDVTKFGNLGVFVSETTLAADLSVDGSKVNGGEIGDVFLVIVSTVPGDFTAEFVIDGADFLAWQRGDSSVALGPSCLLDWEENFGTSVGASAVASKAPEPSSCVLAFLAVWAARQLARTGP